MANDQMKGFSPLGNNVNGLQPLGNGGISKSERMSRLTSMELQYVQQYAEARAENKRPMKYNSLETFDVSHPGKFSRLASPQISLKYRQMSFSTSAILAFSGLPYIVPLKDTINQKIAVVPVAEEELEAVKWARLKDGKWIARTITAVEYVDEIYTLMNWKRDARYKIFADVVNTPRGLALMFDLPAAIEVLNEKEEYVNPLTGEIKHRQVRHFPERYQGGAGKPYAEYEADRRAKQFNDLESFEGSGALPPQSVEKQPTQEELQQHADQTNLDALSSDAREALSRFGRIAEPEETLWRSNETDSLSDGVQLSIPVGTVNETSLVESDAHDGEQVGSE